MIRQGYLFAALVLICPLIERADIVSYLCDYYDTIEKWKEGWRFRDRPPEHDTILDDLWHCRNKVAKDIFEHYGHIVHGDPILTDWNCIPIDDGSLGYAVGKVLNHPSLCDEFALQGWTYLRILVARATTCFPEVKPPGNAAVL